MNKRLPCRQKVKVGNVQWVYRQSNTHTHKLLPCRQKVNVGNVQWAYRQSEVPEGKMRDPSKPAVLLLHGLGSSSYSFRCAPMRLFIILCCPKA